MLKKKVFLLVVFVLTCFDVHSQHSSEKLLLGTWSTLLIQENNGQKTMIDCPDYIEFKANGKYTIYNDCLADERDGIAEHGIWTYSKTKKTITLSKRVFSGDPFYSSASNLIIYIKHITDKNLSICFESDLTKCAEEKYERK